MKHLKYTILRKRGCNECDKMDEYDVFNNCIYGHVGRLKDNGLSHEDRRRLHREINENKKRQTAQFSGIYDDRDEE